MCVEVVVVVVSNSNRSVTVGHILGRFVFYGRYDFYTYKKYRKNPISPIVLATSEANNYVALSKMYDVAPAKKAGCRLKLDF